MCPEFWVVVQPCSSTALSSTLPLLLTSAHLCLPFLSVTYKYDLRIQAPKSYPESSSAVNIGNFSSSFQWGAHASAVNGPARPEHLGCLMAGVPSSSARVPVCWFLTHTSPLTKTACVSSLPLDKFCLNRQTCDLDYQIATGGPSAHQQLLCLWSCHFSPSSSWVCLGCQDAAHCRLAPVAEHQPWAASWNVKPYRVKITLQRWTPFLLTSKNPPQQWMKFYPKKKPKTLGCKKIWQQKEYIMVFYFLTERKVEKALK